MHRQDADVQSIQQPEPTVMVVGTTPEDERDLGVEGGGSRS
jgi:hypothetical protein